MKKNSTKGYVILGILFALVSIIAFAIPTVKTGTFWTAYVFTVVAFALQIPIWNKALGRKEPLKSKFLGIPTVYVSVVYLILQIIAFAVFMAVPTLPAWAAIVVCSIILGLSAVCMISAEIGVSEISRVEEKVKAKTFFIKSLQADVELLADGETDGETKALLKELAEKIRYSDPISHAELAEIESAISSKVAELKTASGKKAIITEILKRTFKQFSMISILSASKNALEVDSKVVNIYDNIANEALAMIKLMPDEVLADYPEIAKIVGECAKQYQYETDALIERFKIYGAELQESAKTARKNNKTAIEEKAKAAEKIALERKAKEQAERNSKYWEEHHAEKLAFETEKAALAEKVDKLTKELEVLPENSTVKQLENQIATLKKEKDALGLFKGKEKKTLQEQIDSLNGRLTTANTAKNNAVAPIQAEIDNLNKRIKEIETELTKDR